MNKIVTLAFSLILSFGGLFSQKIDYDNSSKWYLGFNFGGTWQTTDVANRTSGGWGLTLGRSYNYNYGRRLTFDIRGRYLGGYWYGQDLKTTDSAGYTVGPLKPYMDSLGFAVNNFQTELHSLSLELVLHANGVRERSGWDPYIFGGIGVKWYQTYGDLYFNDSLGGIYNYEPSLLSKTYVNSLSDGVYETALEGSQQNKFTVGVMPSLGFGIGYQVGKRVTLGLEHKTTFTLTDDFDGYAADSKYKQDLYHYTSAFINFRFRRGGRGGGSGGSNGVGNIDNYNNNTNNLTGCNPPVVTYIQPSSAGMNVSTMSYVVVADVKDVIGKENITFKHNGVNTLNFTYNPTTDRLEAQVILTPGSNTFEIYATNTCGSDTEGLNVNYQNCVAPVISLVNPSGTSTSVSNATFAFSAFVANVDNAQGLALTVNNRSVTTYSMNSATGSLQAELNLIPGVNTVVVTAINACGTVSETVTINYVNCVPPVITLVNPSSNNTTVNSSLYTFNASVQNVSSSQGLTLKQNNVAVTNFSYNATTGVVQSNVTLKPGVNTFVITATNNCGTDTKTVTINYQKCMAPVVTVINPATNALTVTNSAYSLNATVLNVNGNQAVTVKQNNVAITNFSFNSATGSLQKNVTLSPGTNTFVITATNDCGTDSKTVTINYQNCIPPVITLVNPSTASTTVNTATYSLSGVITNISNPQGVTLTVNNRSITNYSLNNTTGAFQSTLNLVPGNNTVVITATNACGTVTETITIVYQNCVAPVVTFVNPATSGTTVNNSSYTLNAMVQNVTANQITVTQNNTSITNFNFNASTGSLQKNVTLSAGLNTFVIKATNDCGTDTKTVTINYVREMNNTGGGNQEQKITICHYPPGNNGNPQTVEIPLSAWPAHQAHGDKLGPCPEVNNNNGGGNNGGGNQEEKITICHYPPGNNGNPQTIEIPLSAWPAHQAHGDKLGPCEDSGSGNGNGNGNNGGNNIDNNGGGNEKITICHYPPGNNGNPQTIEIPLSAWPAHQAHGDKLGPCDDSGTGNGSNGNGNGGSGNDNNGGSGSNNGGGNGNGSNGNGGSDNGNNNGGGDQEQKITICHYPPGNNGNPQTIEIPLSAWPAHQAHGDKLGPCDDSESGNGNGSNGNGNGNGGSGNAGGNGNNGGSGSNNGGGNDNGNNGHGNNTDGVDSSNPGQGNGGPNGEADGSGDDENGNGNQDAGATNGSGSNNNGGNTNNNGGSNTNNGNPSENGSEQGGNNGGSGNGSNGNGNTSTENSSGQGGNNGGSENGSNGSSGNGSEQSGNNAGSGNGSNGNGNPSTENGSGQGGTNGGSENGSNGSNGSGSGSNGNGGDGGNGNKNKSVTTGTNKGTGAKPAVKPTGTKVTDQKPGVAKPAEKNETKPSETETKPEGGKKEIPSVKPTEIKPGTGGGKGGK